MYLLMLLLTMGAACPLVIIIITPLVLPSSVHFPPPTLQARSAKRSKTYSAHSIGTPVRRPPHNWSSPTLSSTPSPDSIDGSKNKARLYLSEGPVRIYTSVSQEG